MWLSRMPVTWFNSFIRKSLYTTLNHRLKHATISGSPEYWFLASFSTFSLRTIKLCTWIRPRALWKRSSSVGLCSHLRPGDPSDPTGATIPRASIWTMRLLIALWRSWLLAVGQRTWRWDRGGRRRSDQWNGGGPRRMEFSVFCTVCTELRLPRRTTYSNLHFSTKPPLVFVEGI
ncbi:hypothetical protein BD309DRAFT_966231 [Dichomitus squalens]|nr:hypothetical protein BD309DRAFT_966231 [Dichomitus squalens]